MKLRAIASAVLMALSASACNGGQQAMASDKIEASAIVKSLAKGKSISFNGKHIAGDLDFTRGGAVADGLEDGKAVVSGSVVFVNCVFEGNVGGRNGASSADFMREVSFVGCVFEKDVDFGGCTFRSSARVEKCVVKGAATLESATAQCGLTLSRTEFEGVASFDGLRLFGASGFAGMKFSQTAIWQNIRAQCDVMMVDCHFGGVCDFSRTRVNGDFNLSNSKFGSRVECHDARIYGRATIANVTFGGNVTCEGTLIDGRTILNGTTFAKDVEVTRCTFANQPETQEITITEGAKVQANGNRLSTRPMNTAQ